MERELLAEHERQADFRGDQHLAPMLQFIHERYQVEKSDFYLLKVIPDQHEVCLSLWLWPDKVVDCEISHDGSTFEIVETRAIQVHKRVLRGRALKDFHIVERFALGEQS
ncbi:hypothetical protein [Mesorhizobium sp. LjNodule214]|uniref:hypothetical protein n=1 Tax=Mesorhizobium sp. LjNodule214 TaxID=3342252 RepID=UPI003ECE4834